MKDKAPWRWSKSTLHYITERSVHEFDWPGNSPDFTPIEKSMEHYEKEIW